MKGDPYFTIYFLLKIHAANRRRGSQVILQSTSWLGRLSRLDQWASGSFVLIGLLGLMASQRDNQTIQCSRMGLWWQKAGAVRV